MPFRSSQFTFPSAGRDLAKQLLSSLGSRQLKAVPDPSVPSTCHLEQGKATDIWTETGTVQSVHQSGSPGSKQADLRSCLHKRLTSHAVRPDLTPRDHRQVGGWEWRGGGASLERGEAGQPTGNIQLQRDRATSPGGYGLKAKVHSISRMSGTNKYIINE